GTYAVALDVDSLPLAPVAAINVPAETIGNEGGAGTGLGVDFNVNRPIQVTSLGLFDSGQTGWDAVYSATLWDRTTQKALVSVTFDPNHPGPLIGGSRFKPLPEPLLLPPGQYTITADIDAGQKYFGGWDAQPVTWTTNSYGGAVTFVGSGRIGLIHT